MKKLLQIITVALGVFMILKGTANAGDSVQDQHLPSLSLEQKLIQLISQAE